MQQLPLNSLVRSISNKFIDITFSKDNPSEVDHVVEYAKETLSLGMIYHEFKDAIKEGDGTRVLRCWKYFLLYFCATGHTDYCIEAFNFLALYTFFHNALLNKCSGDVSSTRLANEDILSQQTCTWNI